MLDYEVGLCNVWWSESDDNTRFFSNIVEQNEYFNALVDNGSGWLKNINFNMENGIECSITYRLQFSSDSKFDVVKYNYCCVRYENYAGQYEYRFYYAYPRQDSGGQIIVRLSLDDIQTNFITKRATIAPCLVRRAHLNRFVASSPTSVRFDIQTSESPLLIEEEGYPQLYMTEYQQMYLRQFKEQDLNIWFQNNVAGWVYVFIDPYHKYTVENAGSTTGTVTLPEGATQLQYRNVNEDVPNAEVGVICYPIFRNSNAMIFIDYVVGNDTIRFKLNEGGLYYFRNKNNDSSFFYTKKVSMVSPFNHSSLVRPSYTIDGSVLTFHANNAANGYLNLTDVKAFYTNRGSNSVGVLGGYIQEVGDIVVNSLALPSGGYTMLPYTAFSKAGIVGGRKTYRYNPKLYSSPYMKITISTYLDDYFDYNLLYINRDKTDFLYNEVITPTISKYYLRLSNSYNHLDPPTYIPFTLYNDAQQHNYYGLVGSADTSIHFVNDQYANFLANNSNFWQQTMFNTVLGAANIGVTEHFSKTKDGSSGVSSALGIVADIGSAFFKTENLKNAPSSFTVGNGNIVFNQGVRNLGFYMYVWQATEYDMLTANDSMDKFGFTYMRVDDIYNFTNIRKYHNYIQATVETVSGDVNNIEKDRLRTLFNGGVRFWNTDDVQYEMENYERWLENE